MERKLAFFVSVFFLTDRFLMNTLMIVKFKKW